MQFPAFAISRTTIILEFRVYAFAFHSLTQDVTINFAFLSKLIFFYYHCRLRSRNEGKILSCVTVFSFVP